MMRMTTNLQNDIQMPLLFKPERGDGPVRPLAAATHFLELLPKGFLLVGEELAMRPCKRKRSPDWGRAGFILKKAR